MLKQTLIITSAVLATGLILSGVSVADDSARGHGLRNAQEAAGTHGMQGRCNAASHQNITLNGCADDPLPPPPPVTEPPPVPPPVTEPPPVPPPVTEPPPPTGLGL
jgi:hypothetical protein